MASSIPAQSVAGHVGSGGALLILPAQMKPGYEKQHRYRVIWEFAVKNKQGAGQGGAGDVQTPLYPPFPRRWNKAGITAVMSPVTLNKT